jgi:hypothetical protein
MVEGGRSPLRSIHSVAQPLSSASEKVILAERKPASCRPVTSLITRANITIPRTCSSLSSSFLKRVSSVSTASRSAVASSGRLSIVAIIFSYSSLVMNATLGPSSVAPTTSSRKCFIVALQSSRFCPRPRSGPALVTRLEIAVFRTANARICGAAGRGSRRRYCAASTLTLIDSAPPTAGTARAGAAPSASSPTATRMCRSVGQSCSAGSNPIHPRPSS